MRLSEIFKKRTKDDGVGVVRITRLGNFTYKPVVPGEGYLRKNNDTVTEVPKNGVNAEAYKNLYELREEGNERKV